MTLLTPQFDATKATRDGFGGGSARGGQAGGMAGSSLLLAGWCRAWMLEGLMRMARISASTNPTPVTVLAGGVIWPNTRRGVYQAKHATRRVA